MSDRRQVRVRRSPKIGVFLAIGAVLGALVAIVAVNVTPPDAFVPAPQAIGFLALLLAPLGALLGGVVALVFDAVSERRARTVDAERIVPPPPPEQSEPATGQRQDDVSAARATDAAVDDVDD